MVLSVIIKPRAVTLYCALNQDIIDITQVLKNSKGVPIKALLRPLLSHF